MEREEVIAVVDKLIATCKDGEDGFMRAARDVKSQDLAALFLSFANERKHFAQDLQRLARHYFNPRPEREGTVLGAIHRTLIDTKASISRELSITILQECLRGENSAIGDFENALGKELPSYARAVLESYHQRILEVRDWIAGFLNQREMNNAIESD